MLPLCIQTRHLRFGITISTIPDGETALRRWCTASRPCRLIVGYLLPQRDRIRSPCWW
jgi:hypothetical protein